MIFINLQTNKIMLASGKILKLFNLAGEQASKSNMDFKHGAVCIHSRKILSLGYNTPRSRYMNKTECSLHAEVSALMGYRSKKGKGRKQREESKGMYSCSSH